MRVFTFVWGVVSTKVSEGYVGSPGKFVCFHINDFTTYSHFYNYESIVVNEGAGWSDFLKC